MSLVLRHSPEKIGLHLDPHGWVALDDLIAGMRRSFPHLDRETIHEVVRNSDKQRFALSDDGERIRANQGHSVSVDLQLKPEAPPEFLYHGTVGRFLDSIRREGLSKGKRHHVHLSGETFTATKVGMRRGAAVILTIRAAEMAATGIPFYRSENGVWLVDAVPPAFIDFPQDFSP